MRVVVERVSKTFADRRGRDVVALNQVDFAVEPDVWYHARLQVDVDGDAGTVLGKVWKRDEPEPAGWTVTLEDPTVVKEGSPGIYGDSPTDIYYDNVTVKGNE